MLDWLTPSERRGAVLLVGLLLIGAGWDLWQAAREAPRSEAGLPPSTAPPGMPPGTPPAVPLGPDSAEDSSGPGRPRVDLNQAGARELDALPGIGPVLAGRILDQRRRNGPFRRIEDLLAVRGVGPRLLERLRPHLRTGGEDPPPGDGRPVMQSAPSTPPDLADSTSVRPPPSR